MAETQFTSWVALPPEGGVHDRLKEVIFRNQPREAVGLLTIEGRVIELKNRSSQPESNFEITKADLISVLSRECHYTDLTRIIFWHSHPGGGVGPSRTDIQQKLPGIKHLVATIVNDDLVYTFY